MHGVHLTSKLPKLRLCARYRATDKNLGAPNPASAALWPTPETLNHQPSTLNQVAIKRMKRKYYSWDECMQLREVNPKPLLPKPLLPGSYDTKLQISSPNTETLII
jgi:hypothetical protein